MKIESPDVMARKSFDEYFATIVSRLEQTGINVATDAFASAKPIMEHAFISGFAEGAIAFSAVVESALPGMLKEIIDELMEEEKKRAIASVCKSPVENQE